MEKSEFAKRYIIHETGNELIEKIESLKPYATEKIIKLWKDDIRNIDFLHYASVKKLGELVDSMIFAIQQNNLTVCAILTRIAVDCCVRTYAGTLAADADDFVTRCILGETEFRNYRDANGHKMTDKHLCESFGQIIGIDIYGFYKKVCAYVHLSPKAFCGNTEVQDGNVVQFTIEDKEPPKAKEQMCNELGQKFYFFGMCLLDWIVESWILQKSEEN